MAEQRRSQEERSQTTKGKILEAAIEILFTRGFGAATVQSVASTAKVSRGAMLHHFPSKVDLLVGVVIHAHELDSDMLQSGLAKASSPLERLHLLVPVTWEVLSGRTGIATLEVMMGSRNDPDLAEALETVQTQIEAESRKRVKQLMEASEIVMTREHTELIELVVAAIRGLSIERLFRQDTRPPKSLTTLQAIVKGRLPAA